MTIIVFAVNNEGLFISSSDILISDKSKEDGCREIIPLQYGLFNEASSTLGRKIASKAVIFDNYLLQWAGSIYSANYLIKFLKNKKPKSAEEFFEIAEVVEDQCKNDFRNNGYDEKNSAFSAIINHHDGEKCWYSGWNAQMQVYNDNTIICAGTGKKDLLSAIDVRLKDKVSLHNVIAGAIFKLSILELTDHRHSSSLYGGGYEFFSLKAGGGYRRIGYSFCEVSHYDHIGKKFNNHWFISRVIKCTPLENGSKFETVLLPGPNTNKTPVVKEFFAQEIDCRKSAEDSKAIDESLEFGICLVIDQQSTVVMSQTPFADFKIENSIFNYNFDHKEIKNAIDQYVSVVGKDPDIKTTEDLNKIVCYKCKGRFVEVNFFPELNNAGKVKGAKWLCESCFNKESEVLPDQS